MTRRIGEPHRHIRVNEWTGRHKLTTPAGRLRLLRFAAEFTRQHPAYIRDPLDPRTADRVALRLRAVGVPITPDELCTYVRMHEYAHTIAEDGTDGLRRVMSAIGAGAGREAEQYIADEAEWIELNVIRRPVPLP